MPGGNAASNSLARLSMRHELEHKYMLQAFFALKQALHGLNCRAISAATCELLYQV